MELLRFGMMKPQDVVRMATAEQVATEQMYSKAQC